MIRSKFDPKVFFRTLTFTIVMSAILFLLFYVKSRSHHESHSDRVFMGFLALSLSLYFFYLFLKDLTVITIEVDGINLRNPFFRMLLLPEEIVSIDLHGQNIYNGRTRIVSDVIILVLINGKKISLRDNLYVNIDGIKAALAKNFAGLVIEQPNAGSRSADSGPYISDRTAD